LLPELIDADNTAGDVWADTAYRSKANERFLAGRLMRSQIHQKKPKGRAMSRRTARANARKSAVRSAVEHVFARQKGPMGLFVRTIGLARARTKIGLANLVYNLWTPPAQGALLGFGGIGCINLSGLSLERSRSWP
jgi:IS5 family transposase